MKLKAAGPALPLWVRLASPDGEYKITAAADGPDHLGVGRIEVRSSAGYTDPQVDRPVESLVVPGIGEIQQALARAARPQELRQAPSAD